MKFEVPLALFGLVCVSFTDGKNKGGGLKSRLRNQGTCRLEVTCDDGISLPLKLPLRGPRGHPGTPGPKGDRGEKGDRGDPGVPVDSGNTTSVTRSRAQRVAFFVGLNSNINGVQNDEDAKFDNVITNFGDCYNPETGRFTVPVDGVYQFNIAVAAQGRRCSGSSDVTSVPFFSELHTLSRAVRADYTESEFDRSSQGTDDYKSVGGEYTTVVHSDQHRHLESAPRAGSMAAHTAKSILSPWLYVFLLFGNYFVF